MVKNNKKELLNLLIRATIIFLVIIVFTYLYKHLSDDSWQHILKAVIFMHIAALSLIELLILTKIYRYFVNKILPSIRKKRRNEREILENKLIFLKKIKNKKNRLTKIALFKIWGFLEKMQLYLFVCFIAGYLFLLCGIFLSFKFTLLLLGLLAISLVVTMIYAWITQQAVCYILFGMHYSFTEIENELDIELDYRIRNYEQELNELKRWSYLIK
ncbi:hypothetical protein K5E_21680 [Enterococcus thailandicus]|uniref:hypothetical protein n=1 Tax=Enterococcus thailandicus TaxID=417368 RepID=UPI00244D8576|nr:hypothetical protein [Enterococcus thailandicus]GMC02503.1 hypothetical protein K4E_00130 [Enterococcus thailandicus]GMC10029.1 hypothetical protein K5E_21680 [Enterococcus thailandicus]